MKKLFTLLFIALPCFTYAQSIPNGDFESWTARTFLMPDSGWYSSDPQSITMDDSLTVWKVTGFSGQAIHIQTASVGMDTLQAFIVNIPGDPSKGIGGVPYNQIPTAITGYYRSNIAAGDTGFIFIEFKKAGIIIYSMGFPFIGNTATFTPFAFPIALSILPDSVIIAAASSNLINNIGVHPGSWLELDQLSFVGTTLGIAGGSFDSWPSANVDVCSGWKTKVDGPLGVGVSKTTDHASGSYALKLTTLGTGANTKASGITTGHFRPNSGPIGGLPYTLTGDTLTGYYKYITTGTDTAQINITLTKLGSTVGGNGNWLLPAPTWTAFQIPIMGSTTPDSIRIDVNSSSWNSPRPGSMLYLDKIQLKSQPLGIGILNVSYNTIVCPNPVTDVMNISFNNDLNGQAVLKVYDLTGKVVLSRIYNSAFTPQVTNKIVLSVSQLVSGLYYFTITNNGSIMNGKFIKE